MNKQDLINELNKVRDDLKNNYCILRGLIKKLENMELIE